MRSAGILGGVARATDEHEYYGKAVDNGSIEMGTVGHDDRVEHFQEGTEDNDGHTIVFVTLYRGRDIAQPLNPDVAQGHKVTARLGQPSPTVPAKNSKVLVARPAGMDGPGAWHIIHNPGPSPALRNGPKADDVVQEGPGGQIVRYGADGSVKFATTVDGTSDSPSIQFQMRRDGFLLLGPWGKLTHDANGFHLLTHSGARIDLGGIGGLPAPLDTVGSYANITADLAKIAAKVVALGPDSGVADNVPLWLPLLAILSELVSAIGAVNTVANAAGALAAAMVPSPPGFAATAAAAVLLAAQGSATGALGSVAISMAAAPAVVASKAVTVV